MDGDGHGESCRLLVWVADGGGNGKGTVAFGRCVKGRHTGVFDWWYAEGYSRGFKITHWMELPAKPK